MLKNSKRMRIGLCVIPLVLLCSCPKPAPKPNIKVYNSSSETITTIEIRNANSNIYRPADVEGTLPMPPESVALGTVAINAAPGNEYDLRFTFSDDLTNKSTQVVQVFGINVGDFVRNLIFDCCATDASACEVYTTLTEIDQYSWYDYTSYGQPIPGEVVSGACPAA